MKDKNCYDISVSQTGDLLIARKDGLDIINTSNGEVIKSLPFDDLACSTVEVHNGTVLFSLNNHELQSKGFIVTLDAEYNEVRRWSIPFHICDFTMVDNRLFLTLGKGQRSSNIEVYSLIGEELTSILWNGCIVGITGVQPHSIVYGDMDQHRIYKKRILAGARGFEWTADVKAPRCLCVDDNGLVWIRSNANDCLTILNRDGKCANLLYFRKFHYHEW